MPIRLNIQERADLDMFRAQENQLQAIQLSAEERQELETLQTQQNFLESIRLSAEEHRELVQLRGLRQQFEQQQDLTTQVCISSSAHGCDYADCSLIR